MILRFLLGLFPAQVNITTRKLHTPLHYAIMAGDLESVKILVTHNADINLVHMNNRNALMEAERYNYPEIFEYLEGCEYTSSSSEGDHYEPE